MRTAVTLFRVRMEFLNFFMVLSLFSLCFFNSEVPSIMWCVPVGSETATLRHNLIHAQGLKLRLPGRLNIESWRPEFHNWSPAGD